MAQFKVFLTYGTFLQCRSSLFYVENSTMISFLHNLKSTQD